MKKQILFIGGGEAIENLSIDNFVNLKISFYENDFDFNPFLEKSKNWKDYLEENLKEDYDFIKMQRPLSDCAIYDLWKIAFEKTMSYLNKDLILIGHSLGSIFILKYFSENIHKIKDIKKIFLVSTPLNDTKEEVLGNFSTDLNLFKNLENHETKLCFYQSIDDGIVSYLDFLEYKKIFSNSSFRDFNNYGHFIYNEDFPELLFDIKNI